MEVLIADADRWRCRYADENFTDNILMIYNQSMLQLIISSEGILIADAERCRYVGRCRH